MFMSMTLFAPWNEYPTEEDILESVIDSRISSGAGMYFSS
jgi:hypothetical protein